MKSLLAQLLAFTCLCTLSSEAQHANKFHEQAIFTAEADNVSRPAEIPQDVWKILQQDRMVKNTLDYENLTTEKLPRSWFQASVVHLGGPLENDLLVIANPPLAGGNVTTFWLFLQTRQGIKLVLNAPAHDLVIHSSRTKGHRDIELVALTAIRIMTGKYRFDGTQYQRVKSSDEPIK